MKSYLNILRFSAKFKMTKKVFFNKKQVAFLKALW